jgi:hypothetical protein
VKEVRPVLIITNPITGSAVTPLPRLGLGAAWTAALAPAAPAACPRAIGARPSMEKAARIAEQHGALGIADPAALRLAGQLPNYMTTRISAFGAGAMGPHPEREPEPV